METKIASAVIVLTCASPFGVSSAPLPQSKVIVGNMDKNIHQHTKSSDWRDWSKIMAPFWSKNFVYDFIYPIPKTHGLHQWFKGEHTHFNEAFPTCNWTDMIFAGNDEAATFCSYGIAHWTGPFAGVFPPSGSPVVHVRDLDFYAFQDGQISYNWCMIDTVDILQQVGYHVLPPAPMPNDGYNPPRAMDGIPAPDSAFVDPSASAHATSTFRQMIHEDLIKQSGAMRWWAEDMVWYGPAGIGTARSRTQYLTHFLKPFHTSFSNPKLELDSFLCEGTYCGAHFHIAGNHTGMWLGQPATGRRIRIRFGIHGRIRLGAQVDGCGSCGQIVDGWAQIDIPAAFAQMGVDLFERVRSNLPAAPARRKGDTMDTKQMPLISLVARPYVSEDVLESRQLHSTWWDAASAGVVAIVPTVCLSLLVGFVFGRRVGTLHVAPMDSHTSLLP